VFFLVVLYVRSIYEQVKTLGTLWSQACSFSLFCSELDRELSEEDGKNRIGMNTNLSSPAREEKKGINCLVSTRMKGMMMIGNIVVT